MKEKHKEYWDAFNKYLKDTGSTLDYKKSTLTEQYHNINLGKAWVHIELVANNTENRVALYFNGTQLENERRFHFIKQNYQNEVEALFIPTSWDELPTKIISKISVEREGGLKKEEDRDEQFKWMEENAQKIFKFFKSKEEELSAINA